MISEHRRGAWLEGATQKLPFGDSFFCGIDPCALYTRKAYFMPDSLQDLESRRADLVKQIAGLNDLRSGSISDTSGRCGKPNCRCHQPGQSGAWPEPSIDLQGPGQDRDRVASDARRSGKKPSAKLPSFAASSKSFARSLRSTPRSAALDRRSKSPASQEKKRRRRPAKKPPAN